MLELHGKYVQKNIYENRHVQKMFTLHFEQSLRIFRMEQMWNADLLLGLSKLTGHIDISVAREYGCDIFFDRWKDYKFCVSMYDMCGYYQI